MAATPTPWLCRPLKLWPAGLLALAAATAWLLPGEPRVDGSQAHIAPPPPKAALAPSAAPVGPVPAEGRPRATPHAAQRAPAPSPAPRSAHLAQAFASSVDLRAFVAQAVLDPASGGAFYARRALAECRLQAPPDLPTPAPAAATHRRAQAEAAQADRAARRCAAFLPDELGDDALAHWLPASARAADPLLAVMQAWLEALDADDPPALRRLLAQALQLGDAALLEFIGQSGSGLFQPPGRDEPDGADRVDHQALWDALSCELGAGCRAPRGPPDALCERLPRCATERFGTAPQPAVPGSALADAVAEVQRRLGLVARRQGDALFGPGEVAAR